MCLQARERPRQHQSPPELTYGSGYINVMLLPNSLPICTVKGEIQPLIETLAARTQSTTQAGNSLVRSPTDLVESNQSGAEGSEAGAC